MLPNVPYELSSIANELRDKRNKVCHENIQLTDE